MLTGSIGMLPSASLDSKNKGLYEPIHGSAPDIAGKDLANPLATILSSAMMLRYSLDQAAAADRIEKAVRAVLASGLRTADIYTEGTRKVGTTQMGDAVVAALFQTGVFDAESTRFVWWVLGGYAVGLLAVTQARLYASAFYALGDTRTPLRYAVVRVALSVAAGAAGALWLPGWLGLEARWGTVGLTLASGAAGWAEYLGLRAALGARIGPSAVPFGALARLWAAALPAGAVGVAVKLALGDTLHPVVRGVLVVGAFAAVYAAGTLALGVPEARATLQKLRRRRQA